MKIITIAALKGGVGKTNFTFNLASFLAIEKKKKILLLDLDPQGNLTQCFKISPEETQSDKLFKNNQTNLKSMIYQTNNDNINIIPTDIRMSDLEIKLSSEFGREAKLKNTFSNNMTILENYDYVIIDTNPSLNVTNVNAYYSADSIILLSDNSIHSLRAIDAIIKQWSEISSYLKVDNRIKALILNNFDTFSISKDFLNILHNGELKKILIEPPIKKKQIFKSSEITGTPVIKSLKPEENPYFEIVKALLNKGVL